MSSSVADVISIGSATLDVFIKAPDLKVIKSDEFFTGTAIAAPYGTKLEVEELVIASGGGGTNTAVGLARLGLKAAVLARCGWDFAGKIVRQEIKQEGVDDHLLVQVEKEATDYSTILLGPDGGRTILVYRGGSRLEKAVIDFAKLQTQWLCISSLEGNLALLAELLDWAQKKQIKVAINPGRREIDQAVDLLPLLAKVALLVLNQEEAAQLVGEEYFDVKLFRKAALLSAGLVAVTRGSEGVYLFDQHDRLLQADGFKVATVDATGAGDGFFAGLLSGLIQRWPLEKALKAGLANGAAVIGQIGTKAGLLRKESLANWLEKPLKISWKK